MTRDHKPKKSVDAPVGATRGLAAPGLGESQRAILDVLKRRGRTTIARIARELGLNVETVRQHVGVLEGHGLLGRVGTAGRGRGRPEVVYELTAEAERLFPRQEAELLRGLAEYLRETGNEALLGAFFERLLGERRAEAMERVAHLEGRARLEETARIMSELGFMAEVDDGVEMPALRLCHCPLRSLVDVSRVPCRAELGFVAELLGERPKRLDYMPAGSACCSYGAGAPGAGATRAKTRARTRAAGGRRRG